MIRVTSSINVISFRIVFFFTLIIQHASLALILHYIVSGTNWSRN